MLREGHRTWLSLSMHGLEQGSGFGAEKAFEGEGSTNHVEGLQGKPGACQAWVQCREGNLGRAPRAPTRTLRGPWALQDLCPKVTFFTGFSATGTQLMSSQRRISRSSSVLSQHDRPPWLTSPLGTWKLRPERQWDQKLRGVAETALFTPPPPPRPPLPRDSPGGCRLWSPAEAPPFLSRSAIYIQKTCTIPFSFFN